ncbi:class I SAM-dependent methyltransferase [Streptomyces sp. BPTC-684]|uniref:class I SAM-dependent methyltransferase n=1 Tax=Streptomyces sp. BPTC-684 TaxID=3043734 RepID=UPI0024B0BF23|nr:class I SAM-dependent methyltransferase [Streptomyces sp. BPTC-684]WHM36604.1 class I SAM-dependent methyltransferase [Streptomyces sp. BPTC-684]
MTVLALPDALTWNEWHALHAPRLISEKECGRFLTCAGPLAGRTAIDLGCGTGQWTRQLVTWGMYATGYDFSTEALEQARKAAAGHPRLAFARWDITADQIPTDIQPGQVDLVTCRLSLAYLDWSRLLTDVARWLRPEGTFYALTPLDSVGGEAGRDPYRRGLTGQQIDDLVRAKGWLRADEWRAGPGLRGIMLHGPEGPVRER